MAAVATRIYSAHVSSTLVNHLICWKMKVPGKLTIKALYCPPLIGLSRLMLSAIPQKSTL